MKENMFGKLKKTYVRKIEKNILTYENLFGIIISIRNATFPIER